MTIGFNDIFGSGGASAAKVWTSGMTVPQYAYVISPADKELYQRITATGAGATDPADDVTNYAARSYTRIGNLGNISVITDTAAGTEQWAKNLTKTGLPTWAANARTLLFSASGRGALNALGLTYSPTVVANVRVELLVDGRTIYDQTQSWDANTNRLRLLLRGMPVPGTDTSGANPAIQFVILPNALQFRRSVALYITSTQARSSGSNDLVASSVQSEA